MRAGVALVVACSAAACGEGLVPGSSYDQPLLSFSGSINPAGGIASTRDRTGAGPAQHPLVTLLWTDPLQRQPDVPAPARAIRSTVSLQDDSFTVDLFRPPPDGALVDVATSSGSDVSRLALAEIVVIDDADGDGTFRAEGPRAEIALPDLYLAGSATVVAYVARPFASALEESPLVPAGTVGYQLVGYRCQGQVPEGTEIVPSQAVDLVLQPSLFYPEVRSCRRTHSP